MILSPANALLLLRATHTRGLGKMCAAIILLNRPDMKLTDDERAQIEEYLAKGVTEFRVSMGRDFL